MNLYKALFLCLFLCSSFSVDRSLQATICKALSVAKSCGYAALGGLDNRLKPVDETATYQQLWFSTDFRLTYGPGLGAVFHRAYSCHLLLTG
jgi:hypothetical protein